MRLYEVLTESTQLDEGPKWDAVKRAGTTAVGAVGRGATTLGKGALKAAPAVGRAVGDTIGSAVGGLAGSAVSSFKSAKNAGTDSGASTGSTAPDSTVSPANIPKMNLVQMQQAILAMKPGDRTKLLQFLQSQQPVAKTPVRQAPGATGVKVAGKAPAVRARRSTV
jgi:hypothetical protein